MLCFKNLKAVLHGFFVTKVHLTKKLFEYIIEVAGGKKCANEINGYKEISIFKDGVTL